MNLRNKRFLSGLLSASIIITSLPLMNVGVTAATPNSVSISVPEKLSKTDDPDYNPTFDFESSEWKTKYDTIVTASSDIHDIGRLPNLEEFQSLYGYTHPDKMTLTRFRQTYGEGSEFIEPSEVLTIYIANETELDLMSNLVNNTADSETAIEQAYYSTCSYKLMSEIDYTGTTYQPIGTYDYPFNGTFDGDGYELVDVKLIDDVESRAIYSGYDYLGIFGYTGTSAVIRNLGVSAMTLTANYVLGGDAAFLCARNNGTIEDCYVNGKTTSKLTISNSTAGGICGENYGTIRGCYADAWVDVATHSGTYSEPQPIATVNHTSDGAVVENCYYIRQAYKNLVLPSDISVTSPFYKTLADDNNDGTIMGWKYTGDISQINGTPLNYKTFVENMSSQTGVSFGNGKMTGTIKDVRTYGHLYTLNDLRQTVGSCIDFDLQYITHGIASYISGNSGMGCVLEIRTNDEWNTYCKLVNKTMPNETDEEQAFWASMRVTFKGSETITLNDKTVEVFDLYQDDEPLGTETYPFSGSLNYNRNTLIRLHLENRHSGVVTPVIGYNKGNITFTNMIIDGSDISGYMKKSILCGINDGYLTGDIRDNSYRVTGDSQGVNIYSDNPNYSTLANKNYAGITIVGIMRSGTIEINMGFAYQWYSADDTTVPAGYNYLPLTLVKESGTISIAYGKYVKCMSDETFQGYGTKTTNNINLITDINANSTSVSTFSYQDFKTYADMTISAYPSLLAPEKDENGNYLIRTDRNFIWLTRYATGENAKLMNTIDMSDYTFKGTPFTGSFTLDGTLTDTSDICNNIDLGVTKCYGIINLQVYDTKLSSNVINWNNVYFIGGTFTLGDQMGTKFVCNKSHWLGETVSNIHLSNDYIVNRANGSSSTWWSPAHTATGCSVSGRIIINRTNSSWNYPLSFKAEDCVTYETIVYNVDSYNVTALADTVTHSICRQSAIKTGSFTSTTYMHNGGGIGRTVRNCLADGVYNQRGGDRPVIRIFANDVAYNCTFSGTYLGPTDVSVNNYSAITDKAYGLAITETGRIDGLIALFSSNADCSDIIFRGTFDAYIPGNLSFTATYAKNMLLDGTINIHPSTETSAYVDLPENNVLRSRYGFTKVNRRSANMNFIGGSSTHSIFNSDVNFIGFDNTCAFTDAGVYIFSNSMRGTNINYKDITIDVDKLILARFYVFNTGNSGRNDVAINYGDITTGESVYIKDMRIIDNSYQEAKNFGDVYIKDGFSLQLTLMRAGDTKSIRPYTNYGNITVNKDQSIGGISQLSCVSDAYQGINYGDISVNYNNCRNCQAESSSNTDIPLSIFGTNTGVNMGNIEVKNITSTVDGNHIYVSGGGTENYGDIKVHDLTFLKDSTSYNTISVRNLTNRTYFDREWHGITKNKVEMGNITAKKIYYEGALRITAHYNNTSAYENYVSNVDLDIHDINSESLYLTNGYVLGSYYASYIPSLYSNSNYAHPLHASINANIANDIDINNVSTSESFKFYGVAEEHYPDDKGYRYNNSTIDIDNCSFSKIDYAGVSGVEYGPHAPWVNNAVLNITNTTIIRKSIINGVVSNYRSDSDKRSSSAEGMSVTNAYSFGPMTISVTGAPIVVNGISDGSQINTDANSNDLIVFNASDISVTNNTNIEINGIFSNDTYHVADSKVYNAINSGNLTATQTGSGTVKICGIADKVARLESVENFGNISTNASNGAVYAICGAVTQVATGWVNYGDVSAPNLGAYKTVSTIKADSASANLTYGINYGVFDHALSSNVGETLFLVDLSGNWKTIPYGENTFSTDPTVSGVTTKQAKGYNDFDSVINNYDAVGTDDVIPTHITYEDFISPDFGIRYCNYITTNYITSTTKQNYNSENLFEYVTVAKATGRLREEIAERDGAGGYVLCCVTADGKNLMGKELESRLYAENTIKDVNRCSWWSDYEVHDVGFNSYIDGTLKQRNQGSSSELFSMSITSTGTYETTEGNQQNIRNISMLNPFQAPVKVNNTYANDNIVTIVDLYVLANTYKNIENTDISWDVNVTGDAAQRLRLYNNPLVYSDHTTFKAGIESVSSNLSTTNISGDTATTLHLGEIGKTTYAIIGYLESEDGTFYDILAVRLHCTTTQPMGWVTGFSYAYKTKDDLGNTLDYTQAFNGSRMFYATSKGAEKYDTDGYTLSKGQEEGYSYPIYTMTVPMIHSTNGARGYSDDGIQNTGNVTLNFDVQNIKSYRSLISGDNAEEFEASSSTPTTGSASADGTVIIKDNTSYVKRYTNSDGAIYYKKSDGTTQISIKYNENNPFYHGGNKKIEVFGVSEDNDDEIKLFEIRLAKTYSFENYVRNKSLTNRYWFGNQDNSPDGETTETLDIPSFHENYFSRSSTKISSLGEVTDEHIDFSECRKRGSYTTYPDYMTHYKTIKAEDGSEATYTEKINFVDFNILDYTGLGVSDSYCYEKDGIVVIKDESEQMNFYRLVNSAKTKSIASYHYDKFIVEKFDIFVGGTYMRTANTVEPVNHAGLGVYDSQWGLTVYVDSYNSSYAARCICITKDDTVAKADLPDEPISIKPYIKYELPDGQTVKIECAETTFVKSLNPDRQLLSVKTQKVLTSTYISEFPDAEAVNVDFNGNNVVYGVDYTTLPNLYITDVVEPNCTNSNVSYSISPCATLEQKVGGTWTKVFTAASGANVYTTNYTFTSDGLGAGYVYEYRIVAQDYTTEDPAKMTHITYFTHFIGAATRNKTISIEFKEDDVETMALYHEILSTDGNLSIQLKNMNVDQIKMQQTKFYVDDTSLESNYYNISQGDYAILVNLPDGYTAKVKIRGGSTEGYLTENPNVRGKRLRLPFANSQNIKLEVTLERTDITTHWGIQQRRTSYKSVRENKI